MKLQLLCILAVLVSLGLAALPSRADNLLHNPPPSTWTGRKTLTWLDNMPDRKLKHEWYADLYNQKMWDWCKQFRVVDGKTVTDE